MNTVTVTETISSKLNARIRGTARALRRRRQQQAALWIEAGDYVCFLNRRGQAVTEMVLAGRGETLETLVISTRSGVVMGVALLGVRKAGGRVYGMVV